MRTTYNPMYVRSYYALEIIYVHTYAHTNGLFLF